MNEQGSDQGERSVFSLLRQEGMADQEPHVLKRIPVAQSSRRPEQSAGVASAFAEMVTANETMRALFSYAEAVAATARPVLITGETGVGKELMARALHLLGGSTGAFVPLNVAGADAHLFSDTLFGRRKGGYAATQKAREGFLSRAAGGTLFLDEIGEMSQESQVDLLRLLQQHDFFPSRSQATTKTQARLVLATSRDLQQCTREQRFRSDLYYRLCAHRIHIPPLRERKEDLPLLLERFIREAADEFGVKPPLVPRQLLELLGTYHFPGNVRELKGMVHQAMASSRSCRVLSQETFRRIIAQRQAHALTSCAVPGDLDPRAELLEAVFGHFPTLHEAEELLLQIAMNRARGNQGIAATMLGLKRQTLNMRLKVKKEREG